MVAKTSDSLVSVGAADARPVVQARAADPVWMVLDPLSCHRAAETVGDDRLDAVLVHEPFERFVPRGICGVARGDSKQVVYEPIMRSV